MYKEVDLLHRSIVSCAVHLQLARRQRVYRQGVDIGCHEITQCLVDEAVTLDTIQALEPRGNDRDAEMAASVGGPGMPGMLMTLVFDLNVLGGQRLLKAIPNLVDPSHESVLIAVPSPFGFSAFILAAPVAVQQAMRTMSAMAQMIEVHPRDPQSRRIREVAELVETGGIIAYPTDSSYAFGWAMGNKAAQERIRRLKDLDKHHHFTIVCRDLSEISTYARVDNQAYRLLRALTPGPFTFILQATRQVPNRLQHPKRKTIGLRIPDHPIALALLEELPEPLMSTTLQLPRQDLPMNQAWEIEERLGHELAAIVDGGPCALASTTVVDLTGRAPVVTRQGVGDVSHLEPA